MLRCGCIEDNVYYVFCVCMCVQDEISEELGNMRIMPAKLKAIGESLTNNKLLKKRKAKAKK